MPIEVRGLTDTRRKLRVLRRSPYFHRIASQTLTAGAEEVYKVAKRPTFGFTNRTWRLRHSLRIEQARSPDGRFRSHVQLVAQTPYAHWVEWKRRTRDRRPGPPYWLHRALRHARHLAMRRMRYRAARLITREWRRR